MPKEKKSHHRKFEQTDKLNRYITMILILFCKFEFSYIWHFQNGTQLIVNLSMFNIFKNMLWNICLTM